MPSPESICGTQHQAGLPTPPSPVPSGHMPAVSLSVTASARQSQPCSRPGSAWRVSKPPCRPHRGGCDHRRAASRGGADSPPFLRERGSLCRGMQESPAGEPAPCQHGAPSRGEPRPCHGGNGPGRRHPSPRRCCPGARTGTGGLKSQTRRSMCRTQPQFPARGR